MRYVILHHSPVKFILLWTKHVLIFPTLWLDPLPFFMLLPPLTNSPLPPSPQSASRSSPHVESLFPTLCVFKCILNLPAWNDKKSHWLHLFDLSPLKALYPPSQPQNFPASWVPTLYRGAPQNSVLIFRQLPPLIISDTLVNWNALPSQPASKFPRKLRLDPLLRRLHLNLNLTTTSQPHHQNLFLSLGNLCFSLAFSTQDFFVKDFIKKRSLGV